MRSIPDAGFLPADPVGRQRVRSLSHAIAMEIHPVCNLGTISHVMQLTGGGEEARSAWMRKFIAEGLLAFENMLDHPDTGKFCHGDTPGMADFCLVPQVYNARRWGAGIGHLAPHQRNCGTLRGNRSLCCRASGQGEAFRIDTVGPARCSSGEQRMSDNGHIVLAEYLIGCQDCQIFHLRLGYEHAVKGVSVVIAQLLRPRRMQRRSPQGRECCAP